jgi:hypothetical protein
MSGSIQSFEPGETSDASWLATGKSAPAASFMATSFHIEFVNRAEWRSLSVSRARLASSPIGSALDLGPTVPAITLAYACAFRQRHNPSHGVAYPLALERTPRRSRVGNASGGEKDAVKELSKNRSAYGGRLWVP